MTCFFYKKFDRYFESLKNIVLQVLQDIVDTQLAFVIWPVGLFI